MILLLKIFSIILFVLFMFINIYSWVFLYIQYLLLFLLNFIQFPLSLLFSKDSFTNSKKELFSNSEQDTLNILEFKKNMQMLIILIIQMTSLGFALYLSYSCNNNKLNILSTLTAIVFHPFYILYHLFTTGLCGII